jgi:uncharacterized protein (TIGR03435 family)
MGSVNLSGRMLTCMFAGVRRATSISILLFALRTGAQQPAAGNVPQWQKDAGGKLAFDVASVRENKSGESEAGGDGTFSNIPSYGPDDTYSNTGGVYSVKNYPLLNIIAFAFKSSSAQGQALIESLPPWVLSDNVNIEARSDLHDATKDQMRLMVQSLLVERFHIVTHIETRQVSEFAAVLVKPDRLGSNLRPHSTEVPCPDKGPAWASAPSDGRPADQIAGGFPVVCRGFVRMHPSAPYLRREGSRDISMPLIVSTFTSLGNLGRPVIDQTDLKGQFDWFVEFLPEYPPGVNLPPEASGPSFLDAIKDQLGIRLISQKGPFDYILVDHIEHPTQN